MKKELHFTIDKITNCIEEVLNGTSFDTEVRQVSKEEIRNVHKKDGWFFNWKQEYKEAGRSIYKLTLEGDNDIQGLISIEPVPDQHYIEMHLIESAPHNFGAAKQYAGVAGNLVAFCCKMSFEMGFDGFVAFTAKTELVNHYRETLGAQVIYGQNRMAIATESAKNLVNSYYKDYFDEE